MNTTNFWYIVSIFGMPEFGLLLAGIFLFIWLWFRRSAKRPLLKKFVFVYGISLIAFLGIAFALKTIFPIPRPCIGLPECPLDPTFPSGHAGTVFSLATSAFLIFRKKAIPLFLYAIIVSYSRLAMGVHNFFDVLAGAIFGIVLAIILFLVYKKFFGEKST